MPVHGLKPDLEFAAIVGAGAAVSYFMTGELVSNALFSALLVSLFFLMGLHMDRSRLRREMHRKRELGVGLGMVYIGVPALAFGLAQLIGGGIADGLVAVGASTAAIGSPVVFSNIGKGEDGTALVVAAASVVLGVAAVPAIVALYGQSISISTFALKNFGLVFVPLVTGIVAQRIENSYLDDMRHHFSKLALYLLAAVFFLQLRLVWGSADFTAASLMMGIPVLASLVTISYFAGHQAATLSGLSERQARSIGFVSGSKGLAVSLLVAAALSAEAVVYASMYYFVRQAVLGSLAAYYSGELDEIGYTERVKRVVRNW